MWINYAGVPAKTCLLIAALFLIYEIKNTFSRIQSKIYLNLWASLDIPMSNKWKLEQNIHTNTIFLNKNSKKVIRCILILKYLFIIFTNKYLYAKVMLFEIGTHINLLRRSKLILSQNSIYKKLRLQHFRFLKQT